MQLHQLKPVHKNKNKKRVGRSGVHGHYCCQGVKGKRKKLRPIIRELVKRFGKLRGYKSKSFVKKPLTLNLDILDKKFNSGEKISPQILIDKKLIRRIKGEVPKVKILAKGEIKKPLMFENCLISKSAKEKIEKAGGEIK